ncbi:MAG: hypothetical protein D6767_07090 [Candidatus Hydrogenedentota bacterium]|nr:MAG: hypothetical protein D6767_07090 [Candidatus Hydrogenedentota bacterium]
MKLKFLCIAPFFFMFACSKPKLYTGFEYKINSIDELFTPKFHGYRVEIYDNNRLFPNAKQSKRANYGAEASLEVWKFEENSEAEEAFKKLITEVNTTNLADYKRTNTSGNATFSYTAKDGISGYIWTNQYWLFKAVAKNKETLNDFLLKAELAKLQ